MEKLEKIVADLGWTFDSLKEVPDLQTCPFDRGHIVPGDRLDLHIERCRLRQNGYSKRQINALWPYSETEIRQFRDAGVRSKEAFNPTAASLLEQSEGHSVTLSSKRGCGNGGSSVQQLALIRDLKRRRQSYRGIHTAKKSYIEVLRDVIEHHTALLNNPVVSRQHPSQDSSSTSKSGCPSDSHHSRPEYSRRRRSRSPRNGRSKGERKRHH
uniref:CHHC U11-48K-type domain-containing protein n=1 Tax=Mesocestoides corti TaxID=53468 RepID=A0A5K3F6K6_MESCO